MLRSHPESFQDKNKKSGSVPDVLGWLATMLQASSFATAMLTVLNFVQGVKTKPDRIQPGMVCISLVPRTFEEKGHGTHYTGMCWLLQAAGRVSIVTCPRSLAYVQLYG